MYREKMSYDTPGTILQLTWSFLVLAVLVITVVLYVAGKISETGVEYGVLLAGIGIAVIVYGPWAIAKMIHDTKEDRASRARRDYVDAANAAENRRPEYFTPRREPVRRDHYPEATGEMGE